MPGHEFVVAVAERLALGLAARRGLDNQLEEFATHGCDGKATIAVRVQIPEGVISVKPMPKPGWTLQTKKGKYEKPYQLYDQAVTDGVKEVDWSGGSLPDEFYDEFVFRGTLAADLPAGQKIYFPVVQECEGATTRWIEIPAAGQDEDALEDPAPGLNLLPKK